MTIWDKLCAAFDQPKSSTAYRQKQGCSLVLPSVQHSKYDISEYIYLPPFPKIYTQVALIETTISLITNDKQTKAFLLLNVVFFWS